MKYDYIILGQGIAGTCLGLTLLQQNKTVLIIDKPYAKSASRVAAGIYNPVIFKKITKSWKAEDLLDHAIPFYTALEEQFNTRFLFPLDYLRVFASIEEQNNWMMKADHPELAPFLSLKDMKIDTDIVNAPAGVGLVNRAGYVDTNLFLELTKKYFFSKRSYLEAEIDYSNIKIKDNEAEININREYYRAKKIIFCEGIKVLENPFFKWIEFKPTKGEIITIKSKEIDFEYILKKDCFILPLGNNTFKVGATYYWLVIDDIPSEEGKQELTTSLNEVLKKEYEVTNHEAGIRPNVKDRRPILGIHPEYPQLAIFNGMGSKGVMIAPFYALEFFHHLEGNKTLDREVDVKRFWKNEVTQKA